jgi:hypothetical protein
MRTIGLTAALLGAALLVPMGTATAADESCEGQAATIVGTPEGQIVGTDGADVIVTNGARRVDALGGDDLVCATRVGASPVLGPGSTTIAVLGDGSDTFVAEGDASYEVLAGTASGVDTDTDVIRSTARFTRASTGMADQPNADVIDLGVSIVDWNGVQTPAGTVRVAGGELHLTSTSSAATLDTRNGTMTAADTALAFTGFGEFTFGTPTQRGTFTFRGADRSDRLTVDAPMTYDRDVALGGGRDFYESNGLGGPASRVTGDGGRDWLSLHLHRYRVRADLGSGRVIATKAGVDEKARVRGFDGLTLSAKRADVVGTNRRDRIDVIACRARVVAKAGKDRVSVNGGIGYVWDVPTCGTYRAVILGGPGNDLILGSPGNDRLVGGRGKDIVDGERGRDVCQGEMDRDCEKRL